MNCKNCGKEISEEAYRCPECGEPTEKYLEYAANAQKSNPKETAMQIFKIGGAVIVVIALVFGIVKIAFGKKKNDVPTAGSSETSSILDEFSTEETSTTETTTESGEKITSSVVSANTNTTTTTKASGNAISNEGQVDYGYEAVAADNAPVTEEKEKITKINITKNNWSEYFEIFEKPKFGANSFGEKYFEEIDMRMGFKEKYRNNHYRCCGDTLAVKLKVTKQRRQLTVNVSKETYKWGNFDKDQTPTVDTWV